MRKILELTKYFPKIPQKNLGYQLLDKKMISIVSPDENQIQLATYYYCENIVKVKLR